MSIRVVTVVKESNEGDTYTILDMGVEKPKVENFSGIKLKIGDKVLVDELDQEDIFSKTVIIGALSTEVDNKRIMKAVEKVEEKL